MQSTSSRGRDGSFRYFGWRDDPRGSSRCPSRDGTPKPRPLDDPPKSRSAERRSHRRREMKKKIQLSRRRESLGNARARPRDVVRTAAAAGKQASGTRAVILGSFAGPSPPRSVRFRLRRPASGFSARARRVRWASDDRHRRAAATPTRTRVWYGGPDTEARRGWRGQWRRSRGSWIYSV